MNETVDRVVLEAGWKEALQDEFTSSYMQKLREFLLQERAAGKRIWPPMSKIFNALDSCPLDRVRVVIIGQDPYHNPNQAHGLCFSVLPGVSPPPSLVNIFREIEDDFSDSPDHVGRKFDPGYGCLTSWAEQGVLLLNTVLTVQERSANSHRGYGWERFTDRVVDVVNERCNHVVFLLWGSPAQRKGAIVSRAKHYILEAPHPSPLSAHRGFFGCRHFSKTNRYLVANGYAPIDWFGLRDVDQ